MSEINSPFRDYDKSGAAAHFLYCPVDLIIAQRTVYGCAAEFVRHNITGGQGSGVHETVHVVLKLRVAR